jgi:hypothetical protein
LKELQELILKYTPCRRKNFEKFIKAVKYAAGGKHDKTGLLDRLHGQLQTFELALTTLSMCFSSFMTVSLTPYRDVQTQEALAAAVERIAAAEERVAAKNHRLKAEKAIANTESEQECIIPFCNETNMTVCKRKDVLQWLHELGGFTEKHNRLVAERVEGTGQWFLDSEIFQQWVAGSGASLLFCPGEGPQSFIFSCADYLAGAGKSFMTFDSSETRANNIGRSLLIISVIDFGNKMWVSHLSISTTIWRKIH